MELYLTLIHLLLITVTGDETNGKGCVPAQEGMDAFILKIYYFIFINIIC